MKGGELRSLFCKGSAGSSIVEEAGSVEVTTEPACELQSAVGLNGAGVACSSVEAAAEPACETADGAETADGLGGDTTSSWNDVLNDLYKCSDATCELQSAVGNNGAGASNDIEGTVVEAEKVSNTVPAEVDAEPFSVVAQEATDVQADAVDDFIDEAESSQHGFVVDNLADVFSWAYWNIASFRAKASHLLETDIVTHLILVFQSLCVSTAFTGIDTPVVAFNIIAAALGYSSWEKVSAPRNLASIEWDTDANVELSVQPDPPGCQFVNIMDFFPCSFFN